MGQTYRTPGRSRFLLGTAATACFLLGACGGGGGVNSTPAPTPAPAPAPSPSPSPAPTPAPSPAPTPTPGVTATEIVSPPEAASFGTVTPTNASQGYHTAAVDSELGVGQVFALQQTSATLATSGDSMAFAADTATNAGGASVQVVALPSAGDDAVLRLRIPSLGIDQDVILNDTVATALSSGQLAGKNLYLSGSVSTFDYLGFGQWAVYEADDITLDNIGIFITGFYTPQASMPTTGTASYAGSTQGLVMIQGATFPDSSAIVTGQGTVTADFASGSLTGQLTNMTVQTGASAGSVWNDLALSGTISGASITGTTSIASTVAGNPMALSGTGSGPLSGGFFGPNAEEVGLIWSVQDSNKSVATGLFGADVATP